MKIKYSKNLIPNNREFINDVSIEELIREVQNLAQILNIEYTVEDGEELEKFNGNIIQEEELEEEEEDQSQPDEARIKRIGGITHKTEESRMLPMDQFFCNK